MRNCGQTTFFLCCGVFDVFIVSGGIIPESRRGTALSGLVSNVDWTPTLLSFANMVSHDTLSVASFDGLNQYNYIMHDDQDSLGYRDHYVSLITMES